MTASEPSQVVMKVRGARFLLAVVVLGLAAYGVWVKLQKQSPNAIQSTGGKSMTVNLQEGGPLFLQRDAQWKDDRLGGSKETMGEVGCLVCSVAMAANGLGERTTPKELNAALSKDDGYTRQGWLVWAKLGPIFGNRVEAVIRDKPKHDEIDAALQRGEFPIVKIMLWDIVPHWVMVVGKDGVEYLVRDPLEDTVNPVKLSARADKIQSVRYLRKAGA